VYVAAPRLRAGEYLLAGGNTMTTPLTKRVCLLGWDAADWKMIDPLLEKGQMPNLQKLIDNGVMGNVASLSPMLSPILWTSIATGKWADKHGILGFCEPNPEDQNPGGNAEATALYRDRPPTHVGGSETAGPTAAIRPVTSTSRKCKAIWNIISEQGKRAGVVNWFASHPAEQINGFVVTDRFPQPAGPPNKPWPPVHNSVHPADLLEELCKLRVHPAMTTPQQVLPFVPKLAEIIAADAGAGARARIHSRTDGEQESTPANDAGDGTRSGEGTCSDSRASESCATEDDKSPSKTTNEKLNELRTLLAHCASVQAAATYMMQAEDWDFLGVYFDAIDRFAHAFMEFHPPKMEHVSDRDFEQYQEVMTGIYRFHDMMLGRMMQLAGDDTTFIILSDHGFHCDHLRPKGSASIKDQPVAWHRLHGMVVISGPGIKKDERVYGASLLDIAPTILWLLGLPVPKDMDGKALIQIAEGELREPETIDTYEGGEAAPPDSGLQTADSTEEDPWVAQRMLQQLVDLGYMEQDATVEGVVTDRARNLGQVFAATGRPKEAIAQYEQVLKRKPDDKGTKMAIASCRLDLGELDECERIVREVLSDSADAPHANLYMGIISFRRDDPDKALEYLLAAEQANPRMPGLHVQIGNVYLRRSRWKDAERAFKKALEIDANSAEAHDGLGVAYRWQKRPAEAVHEHMQSVALLHYRPQTHIHLGLALAETGQIDWAIRAFNVAIEQNPNNPLPHRCLAELYERAKQDPDKATEHRQQATRLRETLASN